MGRVINFSMAIPQKLRRTQIVKYAIVTSDTLLAYVLRKLRENINHGE